MTISVKKALVKGVVWNIFEKLVVKGIAFIIGVILARILGPSDYGLIGMLSIFIALSNVFIESGFAKALIQNKNRKDIDFSTAFVTNVSISIVIYLLLFFTAPHIAKFYNEPSLTLITRVLSLNFILGAFNIVHRAKLIAEVDFKSLAIINFGGTIIGGCLGVVLAYMDYGVWALIFQTLTSTFSMMLLFPIFSKWTPSLRFAKQSFQRLFNFGSKLLVTGLISTIVNNLTTILIGRYYKSEALGYYTRATQYSELAAYTINDVFNTTTFPILSSLQDDRERLIHIYRRILFYTALITFPLMTLFALLAEPLVVIMLTEKWLPCVTLLQILCFARMFTPISSINMNLLNAVGRSDLFMKLDLFKVPFVLLATIAAIPFGVEAIVWSNLITTFICFFVNAYLPGKLFDYGAFKQLKEWRYMILAIIVMSVCVYLVRILIHNLWLQLILGLLVALISYIGCCLLFKQIDINEIKSLIKRK